MCVYVFLRFMQEVVLDKDIKFLDSPRTVCGIAKLCQGERVSNSLVYISGTFKLVNLKILCCYALPTVLIMRQEFLSGYYFS